MAEMLTTKSGTKINFHTRIGSLDYKKNSIKYIFLNTILNALFTHVP